MTEKEKVAARAGKARRNAARALIAASENAASGADTEKKDGTSGLKKRDPQSLCDRKRWQAGQERAHGSEG